MNESGDPMPQKGSDEQIEFEPLESGSPFKYPRPRTEGEPFLKILEPLKEEDVARCEAWKEEVQNLLIFAGLFSAVVTAFIVESYKGLRQDSSDISVFLLSRILIQLENASNATAAQSLALPAFSPTAVNIRINILWFLSLIFSLATVLVGIISLQWLREHLRPRGELEPQIAFSLHRMNFEALETWFLPQIFTALPLLLQVAVVLFLVGVIEFLWELNHAVAVPIIFFVGITLLFLLITTVLPTLQALTLFFPRWLPSHRPRSPCPYKSPQSWVFHQLVRFLLHNIIFRVSSYDDKEIGRNDEELAAHKMLSEDRRQLFFHETFALTIRRPTSLIFRREGNDTWLEQGVAWLFQRDLDFMTSEPIFSPSHGLRFQRPVPIYDAISGLLTSKENPSTSEICIVDQCIEPIISSNHMDTDYARYLCLLLRASLSHTAPLVNVDELNAIEVGILQDHNTLQLHWRSYNPLHAFSFWLRSPIGVEQRIAEVSMRITNAAFAHGPQPESYLWDFHHSPSDLVSHFSRLIPDYQEQVLYIVQQFFCAASTYHPNLEEMQITTYSCFGRSDFFDTAAIIVSTTTSSALISQHDTILQYLTCTLQRLSDDITSQPMPDYLFFVSLVYVSKLLDLDSDPIKTEASRDLIHTVFQYRKHVALNSKIWADIWMNRSSPSWSTYWDAFALRAGDVAGLELSASGRQAQLFPDQKDDVHSLHSQQRDAIVNIE